MICIDRACKLACWSLAAAAAASRLPLGHGICRARFLAFDGRAARYLALHPHCRNVSVIPVVEELFELSSVNHTACDLPTDWGCPVDSCVARFWEIAVDRRCALSATHADPNWVHVVGQGAE